MARLSITGLDGIESMMDQSSVSDDVLFEMITAGADVVQAEWQASGINSGFSAPGRSGRGTGAMLGSISLNGKPARIGGAIVGIVGPDGKDSKQKRNAMKAFLLHYGWSSFPATHWVTSAETKAEAPASAAMKAVWDKYNNGK